MARVAFCQDIMVEYMGLMYLSAVLKQAGHTVEVFIDDHLNDKRYMRELKDFRPDIVGFTVLSPSMPWALRRSVQVHEEIGAVTAFGNIHAFMTPEIIEEPGVDIVCLGEGEYSLLELCNAIDKGEDYSHIRGLWVKTPDGIVRNPKREELVDLDALPFHDRQIYDKYAFFRHSSYLRVMVGRGCPFHCSFCSNRVLRDYFGGKSYLRKQSPERAIAEIEHTIKNRPRKVKFVFIIDEVLWVKNDWLREFLKLYKERIGIPFNGNFRFGAIEEEDVKLLADAGAAIMTVAAETGDEQQRKGMMEKPVSNEQILRVAGWLRKYGIRYGSSCFFGLPGDTIEDHVKRLEFYRQVNPTYLWTTFFQPYPGLALTRHPDVQQYMPSEKDYPMSFHHDMYLDLPDRQRLINLKKIYFLCMKFPRLEKLLVWLTKYDIPILFNFLFFLHFTPYILRFERISLLQWLIHVKIFALNPILRKRQPLQNTGRPFTPGPQPESHA